MSTRCGCTSRGCRRKIVCYIAASAWSCSGWRVRPARRAARRGDRIAAYLRLMRLHINVDHVATVRQARRTDEPDPVRAAVLAELGGADGITVHLREDRRHIQDRDVRLLMQTVRTGVNLELAAASDVLDIACELRPMEATLVPERREEITTEGGLALGDGAAGPACRRGHELRDAGIRTSLFIGPGPRHRRRRRRARAPTPSNCTRASTRRRGSTCTRGLCRRWRASSMRLEAAPTGRAPARPRRTRRPWPHVRERRRTSPPSRRSRSSTSGTAS
jgi:hypothetical protein